MSNKRKTDIGKLIVFIVLVSLFYIEFESAPTNRWFVVDVGPLRFDPLGVPQMVAHFIESTVRADISVVIWYFAKIAFVIGTAFALVKIDDSIKARGKEYPFIARVIIVGIVLIVLNVCFALFGLLLLDCINEGDCNN